MRSNQFFFKNKQKMGTLQKALYNCIFCKNFIYRDFLIKNLYVCYVCSYHFPICSSSRLDIFLDKKIKKPVINSNAFCNKLDFFEKKTYKEKICFSRKKTKNTESVISIIGRLHNIPIIASALEFSFIGGSIGSSFGEHFKEVVGIAIKNKYPLVIFLSSGGARMQEGLFSLFQMPKISILIKNLQENSIPYISVLLHPTTGGVLATLGMLGDIIVAEPFSLVGFSGNNIVSKTVASRSAEGFQSSNHIMEYGAVDRILDRKNIRRFIYKIISAFIR